MIIHHLYHTNLTPLLFLSMPPRKQASRDILETYRNSGVSWQAVSSSSVRNIVDRAAKSHQPFDEETALMDLHYWIDRGQLQPFRYMAKRWKWTEKKARIFYERNGILGAGNSGAQEGHSEGTGGAQKAAKEWRNGESGAQEGHSEGTGGAQYISDSEPDSEKKENDKSFSSGHAGATDPAKTAKELAAEKRRIAAAERRQQREADRKRFADQAEDIYAAYPRKVAKPAGIAAIVKALVGGVSFDVLLERTKAYAEVRAHEDANFTPHPATWFNKCQWQDDPSTWGKSASRRVVSLEEATWLLTYERAIRESQQRTPGNPFPNSNYLRVIGASDGKQRFVHVESKDRGLPPGFSFASKEQAQDWQAEVRQGGTR